MNRCTFFVQAELTKHEYLHQHIILSESKIKYMDMINNKIIENVTATHLFILSNYKLDPYIYDLKKYFLYYII